MPSVASASPETPPPSTSDSKRPSAAKNLHDEILNHPGRSGLKPAKKRPTQANTHFNDELTSTLEQRRPRVAMSLSDNIPYTGSSWDHDC